MDHAHQVSAINGATGETLRVLFAVDSHFPGLGGAESQALKLATALRERGVHVDFVTPRVRLSQSLTEHYDGFQITRIDYPHIKWLGSLVLMGRFFRYLICQSDNYDAVHVHITHLMAAAAGFARSRSRLPVVVKISGFYEFEGGVLDPGARYKPLNFLIRLGLKRIDFVQSISHQTRHKLLQAGFTGRQIQFVPNGIDIRQPPVEPPGDGTLRIGYCGRLREVKGVHVLIEGYALLKKTNPELRTQLLIAGSGDTRAALDKLAVELGVQQDIQWLGTIEDTVSFYQSLDIYVQPSFAEGLPNAVMEAMIAQRAVVASNIGGNTDLVTDGVTGLLFKAGDADQLAQALRTLARQPGLAQSLARAGRQLIKERYGFDIVIRQLVKLYREQ